MMLFMMLWYISRIPAIKSAIKKNKAFWHKRILLSIRSFFGNLELIDFEDFLEAFVFLEYVFFRF